MRAKQEKPEADGTPWVMESTGAAIVEEEWRAAGGGVDRTLQDVDGGEQTTCVPHEESAERRRHSQVPAEGKASSRQSITASRKSSGATASLSSRA